MKNIDMLKKELCEKINGLGAEDLYEYILQPQPILICKYCESVWGLCPDTQKNDAMCINRFKAWCEMKNNTVGKDDEPERS